MKKIIDMRGVVKTYNVGKDNELEILHGIDLVVHEGEFVAIVGESGSGKSTIMNIIGALDKPTSGEYFLSEIDIGNSKDHKLSGIRNEKIGFVFQNFNLIGRTSALKNVELPMLYNKMPRSQRSKKAKALLEKVGMKDRMHHQPNELSGGQKQRVAIARALANSPELILADEPTGALDSHTSRMVMDMFHSLHKKGSTIVLITHSNELAQECERIVKLKDGDIVSDTKKVGAMNA